MSKTSKKKHRNKVEKKKSKQSRLSYFERNIISLVVGIIIVITLYYNIDGYRWLFDSIIMNNLKTIKKYPDLSIEQKWEIKLGFDYKYLNFIKNNTLENAVILMPPDSALFPKNKKSEFTRGSSSIKNKAWATYFIYPRKLVYEYELETHPFAKEISHIAIANYWGYEYLKYQIKTRQKYQILPVAINKETE